MADVLRPDIERAQARMQTTVGARREIKRLAEYLWDDEQVERMVSGSYGGGTGLLVFTNRRLLFIKDGVMKKTLEDFPLDKVSSVQWSSGLVTGKILIFASGNKAEVSNLSKQAGKEIADLVRDRISRPSKTVPMDSQTPRRAEPASVADELKKLAELRDGGVLTDDEFAAQKARLLQP